MNNTICFGGGTRLVVPEDQILTVDRGGTEVRACPRQLRPGDVLVVEDVVSTMARDRDARRFPAAG